MMSYMQSLNDDERREILGEVLLDELRVIREYVQDIPGMKQQIHEINERLIVVEGVVNAHEFDIRQLRQQLA